MKKNIIPKNRIKLDHLGQYYASIHCKENPGTFGISVHLKENLKPDILQQAVNDIVKRLPHLNVRLNNGFFWYYHEVLKNPLKIMLQPDFSTPARHFKKGEPLTRIIYGERHFTVEVLHTVCDGRSLAKIVSALLARYFEILGYAINKKNIINPQDSPTKEEVEDAYKRHADLRKQTHEKGQDVYMPHYQLTTPKVITQHFDLNKLKDKAQAKGVTLTEYIMTLLTSELAKQREKDGCQKPITVNVPIDCRGFFPSECLRNFVSNKTIIMPESMNFTDTAQGIKAQLTQINADYIQEKISELENLIRISNYIPLFIKKWLIKKIGQAESTGHSTAFSNLGLIKLPTEIEDRIEMMSFALGAEAHVPYQFGCVATQNTLTLTTTTMAKDNTMIENIYAALK